MNPLIAQSPPVSDLLDVFNAYDGGVIFRGLTDGTGGEPAVLGRIGWIFTGFGALFTLWGFILRAQRSGGEGKLGEIAKTWIVIALIVGGPFLMRTAMEGADAVYESSTGGPRNLTAVCVKAAYAMPELSQLFDVLRRGALSQPPAQRTPGSLRRETLIDGANDGSVLGYLEAYGVAVWDTASDYASSAETSWNGIVRLATMGVGLGSAMLKCMLIAVTVVPLYLLLLCAAAIVWFMEQLRYFLAVSGTMMLPLFTGMFSLPEGNFARQAAQGYVMNMVSLALWPVAWAIGHSGTIALYDALVSLIAGTSRVPEMAVILQWGSIASRAPSEAQLRVVETALGNWFMGNVAALLSILVGGIGFFLWVATVSILGPVFLHRLLSTGAHFMSQAAGVAGRQSLGAGRLALNLAQGAGFTGGAGLFAAGAAAGERLAGARAADAVLLSVPLNPGFPPGAAEGGSSMGSAASRVDESKGILRARL